MRFSASFVQCIETVQLTWHIARNGITSTAQLFWRKEKTNQKKLTLVEVYSCCVIYKLKYMHLSEEVRVQGSIAKIIIMVGHGHGSFSKKSKHCDLKISYAELIVREF